MNFSMTVPIYRENKVIPFEFYISEEASRYLFHKLQDIARETILFNWFIYHQIEFQARGINYNDVLSYLDDTIPLEQFQDVLEDNYTQMTLGNIL